MAGSALELGDALQGGLLQAESQWAFDPSKLVKRLACLRVAIKADHLFGLCLGGQYIGIFANYSPIYMIF